MDRGHKLRLIRHSKMPPTPRHVFRVLDDFAGAKGSCYPSMDTIAEATGYSKSTVSEAINWLQGYRKEGKKKVLTGTEFITKTRRGRHSVYTLNYGEIVPIAGTMIVPTAELDHTGDRYDGGDDRTDSRTPSYRQPN